MRRLISLFAISFFVLSSLFAPAHAEDIVIAQVAPLSGVLADTGREMVLGGKIYFDHINANGGINGRKIQHVVKDDGYVVDKTVELTREAIVQDKAIALFGFAGTGNISRLLSDGVLAQGNIPLVAPYTGGAPLRDPYNPYIFHVRASYADETAAMVDFFVKNGLTRIAVMYQADPFGESGLAGVMSALRNYQLAPVVTATYTKNTDDVATAVKTIAATDPQAIIMVSINKSTGNFVKQYAATGKSALMFNISVVNPKELMKIAGAAVRGVGITQVVPYPFFSSSKLSQEYLELLKRHGGADAQPSYASFEEFIGAKVLVEGLKRAGKKLSRETLMQALESIENFDLGGGFKISYGKNNRIGSRYVDLTVIAENGQLRK